MPEVLAEIHFALPIRRGFDYRVPAGLRLEPGQRVRAPFGKRGTMAVGMTLRVREEIPTRPLKTLNAILDPAPVLDEKDFALATWISHRYCCPLGEALMTVTPLGQLNPSRMAVPEDSAPLPTQPSPHILSEDQAKSFAQIDRALIDKNPQVFVLMGVAAAGKTEVYLRAVERVIAQGGSALYLVPEIGLTPQTVAWVKNRLGSHVGVWHSGCSDADRVRLWREVTSGRIRVVVGPRSALFFPLPRLGLIIVDEEHDASYKQDRSPHYHARDTAVEKARLQGAVTLLGSATPSLETFQRARSGEWTLLEMPRRVLGGTGPGVRLVDMRGNAGYFLSDALVAALRDRLQKKEQSFLLLNRRGYFTFITCKECGWEARCPQCRVAWVYHKDPTPELRCHTCGQRAQPPEQCPTCHAPTLKLKGKGTQRVLSDVQLLFPEARILRWDRDALRGRGAHDRTYRAVASQEVDIVIGTKMIAQGLDFPRVSLVGVVDADEALRFPDFRASEKCFQLLTQVAGRAGRAEAPGEVLLQTRQPEHEVLQAVQRNDFRAFADHELLFRQELGYPPFMHLIQCSFKGDDDARAELGAVDFNLWCERAYAGAVPRVGPTQGYRPGASGVAPWSLLLKVPPSHLNLVLAALPRYEPPTGVRCALDVDPELL